MPAARAGTVAGTDEVAIHTRRQIAVRLLPFLFVLYVANYLDRTSVAYAALEMSRDLGFNDRVIGLSAGIFFVGYVALQIPGALMVEHWSARRCVAVIMMVWGSLTVLTGLVHTANQLYAARLVLGAAEAGFFPGVMVYLSHWFTCQDRAKATANFMAAIPLSFILGSPLAGWILGHHWLGMQGWRWLFALEGMPAVVLGMVAYFYLTDWPAEARWLPVAQREWIVKALEAEKAEVRRVSSWQALRSGRVQLLAAAAFTEYFVFYSLAFWFPTILKRWTGISDARIGWLGAIPYVVCLAAMVFNGWHSDRHRERRLHSAIPVLLGTIPLLALLAMPRSIGLIIALFSMLVVIQAFLPTFWALVTESLCKTEAATAVGFINAVGSIAGFAGPYAFGYLANRTGSFSAGLTTMLISCAISGLLLLRVPEAPKSPA
jgi:ACS family tartrate transporter-like MFS transporter